MSFGLTPEKLILLAVLAAIIIGPTRLPDVAAKLANVVRALRRLATQAEGRMREELGPEFDAVDWRKLDPRKYDPRRIIRDAAFGDDRSNANIPTAGGDRRGPASGEGRTDIPRH